MGRLAALVLLVAAGCGPVEVLVEPDGGDLRPTRLRVEGVEDPLGVDADVPRLSWALASDARGARQSAYEVHVATGPDRLAAPDVWDSGRVESDETLWIDYGGPTLDAGQRVWWTVRSWDAAGRPGPWAEPATWSRAAWLGPDWEAEWIGPATLAPADSGAAILMRTEIEIRKPVQRATATVSGLGYYELAVDGRKVGDHVLDPAWTDYTDGVQVVTYDVTEHVGEGRHALGVTLSGGFFHLVVADLFKTEEAPWRALPRLLLQLDVEHTDGTTATVASGPDGWRWATGPVRLADVRGGETHDLRERRDGWQTAGYDDADWTPAVAVDPPAGKLRAQLHPPLREVERVRPVSIIQPAPGVVLVDFGKNLTGWVELTTAGPRGTRVVLHHNEVLRPDGTLDTLHSAGHTWGGRFQKGELVLAGDGRETFAPRFTYHGFRYVQVEGLAEPLGVEDVVAVAVHTDLKGAGRFASSNGRLNELQGAIRRTLLNSVHGLPGEEPTREKMGWTYDALVLQEAYLYNFDAGAIYRKYAQDLIDAQDDDGHMPPIAPTPGIWRSGPDGAPGDYADPWWGVTLAFVPQVLWEFTGDRRPLEEAYPHVRDYVEYLRSRGVERPGAAPGSGLLLDWRLGDWLDRAWDREGRPGLTPIVETSTAAFYAVARMLARNAERLGIPQDAARYGALADSVRQSFNAAFFDAETACYGACSQASQAVPLWVGLVPDGREADAFARLADAVVAADTTVTAGFVGAFPLMEEVADRGRADLAFRALMQEGPTPGWLWFVEDETSTLGENLNPRGYGTGHHPYAAFVGFWPYRALAGVRPLAPGFRRIGIAPSVVDGLDAAEAVYESVRGEVASRWRREGDAVVYDVTVPANTTAEVVLPTSDPGSVTEGPVRETRQPVAEAEGVVSVELRSDAAVVTVGSGTYSFRAAR